MSKEEKQKGCCEKCHDIYFTDDYPIQETLEGCINQTCPCHQSSVPEKCICEGSTMNMLNACPVHYVKAQGKCEHFGIKINGTCGRCGMYVVPPKAPQKWEEQIKKVVQSIFWECCAWYQDEGDYQPTREEAEAESAKIIFSLLSSTIAQTKEQEREKLIENLLAMKKIIPEIKKGVTFSGDDIIWNSALDEVLQILQNQKE